MELSFSINGDIQLSRNLRVFVTHLSQMSEFYTEAIGIIEDRTDLIFSTSGSVVEKSVKWKPLAASTIRAREKRWGYYKKSPKNPGTMRWTGNLQENKTKKVNDKQGSLSFNAKYANYHQEGGKNLPKRAILDISNSAGAEIVRAAQNKINRDIGISGLQA